MSQVITRTKEQAQLALKKKVRMFYDLQRLRLQCSGRVNRESGTDVELHEIDKVILEGRAKELFKAEKLALKDVEHHLKGLPMWTDVLSERPRFKGLGVTMAGVILAENDITRQDTVSKMWSFAGLRPVPTQRCKLCHSVMKKVVDETRDLVIYKHAPSDKCDRKKDELTEEDTYSSAKAMRPTKGEKLPYNAFLKTKIVGVLGPCLLKANSPWRKFYDDYKHRKISAGWGKTDGHRHNASIRYMVKQLLVDVHREWRTLEGLPVRAPYAEEYLGKVHSG